MRESVGVFVNQTKNYRALQWCEQFFFSSYDVFIYKFQGAFGDDYLSNVQKCHDENALHCL